MKCPKCGYNSFDYLDSCKKCNKDLTEHKARFNIQSVLLSEIPVTESSTIAEEAVAAATASTGAAVDDFAGGGEAAEEFGFDFMGDSEEGENLAFDELFEEEATEDDIEETLPAPEAEPEAAPLDQEFSAAEDSLELGESKIDDFSFDETEPNSPIDDLAASSSDGPSDFGFDAEEDPAADIFAETEEDFSLDGIEPEDSDKI
jgi:hypothetical protein